MATLSVSQRADLQQLVDYLNFNRDLPVDERVVQTLDKVFGDSLKSTFPCVCSVKGNSLRDGMRDEPVRTFLRILIAQSDLT